MDFRTCRALICCKCLADLEKAMTFRNLCKETDQRLRKSNFNTENIIWDNALKELRDSEMKLDSLTLNTIKNELIDSSETEQIDNKWINLPDSNYEFFDWSTQLEAKVCRKKIRITKEKKRKGVNCQECTKRFDNRKILRNHMIESHEASMSLEKKHKRQADTFGIKGKNQVFGCHYCPEIYESKIALKDHVKTVHEIDGSSDFLCDVSIILH